MLSWMSYCTRMIDRDFMLRLYCPRMPTRASFTYVVTHLPMPRKTRSRLEREIDVAAIWEEHDIFFVNKSSHSTWQSSMIVCLHIISACYATEGDTLCTWKGGWYVRYDNKSGPDIYSKFLCMSAKLSIISGFFRQHASSVVLIEILDEFII